MKIFKISQNQYPYYIAQHSEGRLKGQYPMEIGMIPSLRNKWDKGGFGTGKKTREFKSNNIDDLLNQLRSNNINPSNEVDFYIINGPNRARERVQYSRLVMRNQEGRNTASLISIMKKTNKSSKLAQNLSNPLAFLGKLFVDWIKYIVPSLSEEEQIEYDKLKKEVMEIGNHYYGLQKIINKVEYLNLADIGDGDDFKQFVEAMGRGLHGLLKEHKIEDYPALKEKVKDLELEWVHLYDELKYIEEKHYIGTK